MKREPQIKPAEEKMKKTKKKRPFNHRPMTPIRTAIDEHIEYSVSGDDIADNI